MTFYLPTGYVARRRTGALPGASERSLVKQTLEGLGAEADVSGVRVEPQLLPNPWLERALARSGRGPNAKAS